MASNMGSIECIGVRKAPFTNTGGRQKYIKEFRGLRADFDKLPTDDDQATSSSVIFLDTSEYAEYHAPTKTWYIL